MPLFSKLFPCLFKTFPVILPHTNNVSLTGSSNTWTCLYKRACILPQGQFLKYTEITFLHRDVTQTHSLEMDWNRMTAKYLSEVQSQKKGMGSLSIPKPELYPATPPRPVMPRFGVTLLVRDPVPGPLNSIYTLVFFRNVLDLYTYFQYFTSCSNNPCRKIHTGLFEAPQDKK